MGLIRFLTRYDNRFSKARQTLEKQASLLEGFCHRQNGEARKDILSTLKNIDEVLEKAWSDLKPGLQKEFPAEWRDRIETEAWITYFMNQRLFDPAKEDAKEGGAGKEAGSAGSRKKETRKRNFYEVQDYRSSAVGNEKLAKFLGIYKGTFNHQFESSLEEFQRLCSNQITDLHDKGLTGIHPDSSTVRRIVTSNFIDYLYKQMETAIHRGDIEPAKTDPTLGCWVYVGPKRSRFHIFAERIQYLARDLKDSQDPGDRERFLVHTKRLREKEVRAYEQRAKAAARTVESRKQKLAERGVAFQDMLYFLETWAYPLNKHYAALAEKEGTGDAGFERQDLFRPGPDFYEKAVEEIIRDMDPDTIGSRLPGPRKLKLILDNIINSMSKAAEKVAGIKVTEADPKDSRFAAAHAESMPDMEDIREMAALNEMVGSDGRELGSEILRKAYQDTLYSAYRKKFLKQARLLVAEVMESARRKIDENAFNEHTVSELETEYNILHKAYAGMFPGEINLDIQDLLNTGRKKNIKTHLGSILELFKKYIANLDFNRADAAARMYDQEAQNYSRCIPEDIELADLERVKAAEIVSVRDSKKPEDIASKCEDFYQKADECFDECLQTGDEEKLEQGILSLDNYVKLCENLAEESGRTQEDVKSDIEKQREKFQEKLRSAKQAKNINHIIDFGKKYTAMTRRYDGILEQGMPQELADVYQDLDKLLEEGFSNDALYDIIVRIDLYVNFWNAFKEDIEEHLGVTEDSVRARFESYRSKVFGLAKKGYEINDTKRLFYYTGIYLEMHQICRGILDDAGLQEQMEELGLRQIERPGQAYQPRGVEIQIIPPERPGRENPGS